MAHNFRRLQMCWARITLRWRLALVSFGLLALLLSILGSFVSYNTEQALLISQARILYNQTQQVAATWKEELATAQKTDNPAKRAVKDIVDRFTDTRTQVTAFAPDGKVLATSEMAQKSEMMQKTVFTYPQAVPITRDQLEQASSASSSEDSYLLIYDGQGQRHLVVLYPLPGLDEGKQPAAILLLNTLTTQIDLTMTSLRLILFLGILAALLIAAVCTLPLINVALRPLVVMERTSGRIAGGDLSLRLDVPPARDEIGQLARTFNHMVAQLEAAFTRQKRFVADVSHELRTPLTALSGSMEMVLLGADQGNPLALRRLVRGMYAEVQRMQRLVVDLLALTRLDEGQAGLRKEPLDLSALLEQVCQQVRQLARGQEVQCQIAGDLPPLLGDADRLQQVFLNITENALKYTPVPGYVRISAACVDRHTIELAIQDSGVGIPPEDLPHVFDRFYRVDPARSRVPEQTGGNGLGLSIVKELVEAHGGQIAIASEVGVGTTVTIKLPAV